MAQVDFQKSNICSFLSGEYMLSCKIDELPFVPSRFQIEEYCKSLCHRMCPFFLKKYDWSEIKK